MLILLCWSSTSQNAFKKSERYSLACQTIWQNNDLFADSIISGFRLVCYPGMPGWIFTEKEKKCKKIKMHFKMQARMAILTMFPSETRVRLFWFCCYPSLCWSPCWDLKSDTGSWWKECSSQTMTRLILIEGIPGSGKTLGDRFSPLPTDRAQVWRINSLNIDENFSSLYYVN